MKHIHLYFTFVCICLTLTSCKKAHDAAQKSKYGDADRIKCRVIARGGIGETLDSMLARASNPIPLQSLSSLLKLPGSGVLKENLVICEKCWYWGGAMQGFKWFEVENRKTLVISTPSSVPSAQEIIIYTTERRIGKSGEYKNYEVLGSVGDVEVWRYTDIISTGDSEAQNLQTEVKPTHQAVMVQSTQDSEKSEPVRQIEREQIDQSQIEKLVKRNEGTFYWSLKQPSSTGVPDKYVYILEGENNGLTIYDREGRSHALRFEINVVEDRSKIKRFGGYQSIEKKEERRIIYDDKVIASFQLEGKYGVKMLSTGGDIEGEYSFSFDVSPIKFQNSNSIPSELSTDTLRINLEFAHDRYNMEKGWRYSNLDLPFGLGVKIENR